MVIAAALLILVNDFVLRGVASTPEWLTGKLSDIGWLVVVPVLLEALFNRLMRERTARGLAIAAAVAVYTALQLWPPLGAWLKPDHVADVGDLRVLPAVFGALFVWRTPRLSPGWAAVGAWPVLLGALLADSFWFAPEASWPCGDGMVWETAEPLRLRLDFWPPSNTDAFVRGLRLRDSKGVDVRLVVGETDDIAVCARDGLQPNTSYTWEVGPWQDTPSNEAAWHHDALPTVTFRTSASEGIRAASGGDCAALVHELSDAGAEACDAGGDTGDTSDTTGTDDTGDTSDTSDTSDTAVSP